MRLAANDLLNAAMLIGAGCFCLGLGFLGMRSRRPFITRSFLFLTTLLPVAIAAASLLIFRSAGAGFAWIDGVALLGLAVSLASGRILMRSYTVFGLPAARAPLLMIDALDRLNVKHEPTSRGLNTGIGEIRLFRHVAEPECFTYRPVPPVDVDGIEQLTAVLRDLVSESGARPYRLRSSVLVICGLVCFSAAAVHLGILDLMEAFGD